MKFLIKAGVVFVTAFVVGFVIGFVVGFVIGFAAHFVWHQCSAESTYIRWSVCINGGWAWRYL